jgi:hypothetical protein
VNRWQRASEVPPPSGLPPLGCAGPVGASTESGFPSHRANAAGTDFRDRAFRDPCGVVRPPSLQPCSSLQSRELLPALSLGRGSSNSLRRNDFQLMKWVGPPCILPKITLQTPHFPPLVLRRWAEQGIDVLLNRRPAEPGVLPQPLRNSDRVDAGGLPPRSLIAVPVGLTMVGSTERHGELIADPSPQGPGLHESEVMGIGRLPPADEARLRRHELQMGAVAVTARLAQGKHALVDMPENGIVRRLQLGLRRPLRLR